MQDPEWVHTGDKAYMLEVAKTVIELFRRIGIPFEYRHTGLQLGNIIHLLTYGEQCANELLEQMRITQSTLSHHMKILVDCGLVSMKKKAKWSHYSLNGEQWSAFRDYIESIISSGLHS